MPQTWTKLARVTAKAGSAASGADRHRISAPVLCTRLERAITAGNLTSRSLPPRSGFLKQELKDARDVLSAGSEKLLVIPRHNMDHARSRKQRMPRARRMEESGRS